MRIEQLDNQPVFATVDEMIEHFAGGAEVLAVCPANVNVGSSRVRLIVLTVVIVSVAALIQRWGGEVLGYFLASFLTEAGLSVFFFALMGYGVYRLIRPKTDLFLVTDDGVIGLKGIARTVHGVSAAQLLGMQADRIEKYRFSKWRFPQSFLRLEERETHDFLAALQNRLWNKKHLVGARGRSLRDALALLRLRGSPDPGGSWGREASVIPIYLQTAWIIGAVASAVAAVVVGIPMLFTGPDGGALAQQGMEAYEQERYADALGLFERAAEDGNPDAQAHLGRMYELGLGVTPDLPTARRWYEPAAEADNTMAQSGLGYLLLFAPDAVPGEAEEGVRWLRAAAEQNDARAQNNLGAVAIANDEPERARWRFYQAADQGFLVAQRNLADLYYKGVGGDRSYPDALDWYRRAAEQGDAVSQRWVGFMHDRGQGTDASYEEAMRWYGLAAEQGDSLARSNIQILTKQRPARQAVRAMELETRPSLLDDGTSVLRLRNVRPLALDLDLTCYRGTFSKTMDVTLAALGTEEVGFLEGWTGNFVAGDRCEIYYAGALMRGFSIR